MKAEIIAVGTELLLGQILNSNAQFLSQQCAMIGIDVYFQTVVGDNENRLRDALDIAKSRADLIICTGGLGPTQDDLTKDVLARYLDRKLVIHRPSMDKMTSFFESRSVPMVESNARQALMLEGSDPLANDTGLAVGTALTVGATSYMLLPGPPKEMRPMFEIYGKQWLLEKQGEQTPLHSVMLKFAGIGESNLEHALIDLIKEQQDPTLAPYAKDGEVTIRLTTRAASMGEAEAKFADTKEIIRQRLGNHLYAEEDMPIEQAVYQLLKAKGYTLSSAESCTGGLFSDMLTSVPDSSSVFAGGVVTYTNRLKNALLQIPMEQLEGEQAPGAVSEETARSMADGMLAFAGTDFAVSITGVAGPSPSEGKPVGLVYIGIAQQGKETSVVKSQFTGNRDGIKWKAAKSSFYHLWLRLKSAVDI